MLVDFIMERSQYEINDFDTSSDSDEHPLLNEKTTGSFLQEGRDSLLNGFFFRRINKALSVLLLISVAANIVSFVHMVTRKGQVTLCHSAYGLFLSISSPRT